MPRWLVKAKSALRASPVPEPQPYSVTCVCGRTLEGLRAERHREVRCEECGELLFVLPRDVYPLSESKKKRSRKPSSTHPPPAALPDEAEPAQPAEPDGVAVVRPPEVDGTTRPDLPSVAGGGDAPVAAVSADRVLTASEKRRSPLTPFRAVVAVMVVVVSATIYWAVHARSLDRAAVTAQRERDKADAALEGGDFAAAAVHYRIACEALETLGRNDPSARATCQLARETTAAAGLAVAPLADVLEQAHESLSAARTEAERTTAEEHALDLYAGQWIVMETTLFREGDGEKAGWQIDYPFSVGTREVVIDSGLPIFEELPSSGPSTRVIFAAQLRRCRLSEEPRPAVVLELNGETAFLWTNYEILRSIGFGPTTDTAAPGGPADDAFRSLLEKQSRIVGIAQ